MDNFLIREMERSEFPLLEDFLYESIFQKKGAPPLPRDVTQKPELRVYFENFGKMDDNCVVAEHQGKPVGAVWTRLLSGKQKGYGYIDDQTPELSISLYPKYRGLGAGTDLMHAMLFLLKQKGYRQVSLSVTKENPAVRLYQRMGFETARETAEDFLMTFWLG